MSARSASIERVVAALAKLGINAEVRELPESTRSAADAARAIGCDVGQIAKSIVFRGATSNRAILVIASGANYISESKIAAAVGEPVEKADAAFVRERTGFVIGGVPPVGHGCGVRTLIDEFLLARESVWVAAGTPHSVVHLRTSTLAQVAQDVLDLAEPIQQ